MLAKSTTITTTYQHLLVPIDCCKRVPVVGLPTNAGILGTYLGSAGTSSRSSASSTVSDMPAKRPRFPIHLLSSLSLTNSSPSLPPWGGLGGPSLALPGVSRFSIRAWGRLPLICDPRRTRGLSNDTKPTPSTHVAPVSCLLTCALDPGLVLVPPRNPPSHDPWLDPSLSSSFCSARFVFFVLFPLSFFLSSLLFLLFPCLPKSSAAHLRFSSRRASLVSGCVGFPSRRSFSLSLPAPSLCSVWRLGEIDRHPAKRHCP